MARGATSTFLFALFATAALSQSCTPLGERCAGEAGYPFVAWLGCCTGECVAKDGDWGKFCIDPSAPSTPTEPTSPPTTGGTPVMPPGEATCTPAGARCIGAAGFPAVPWLGGCCAGAGECVTAPDWGQWCSGGSATTEAPVTEAPVTEVPVTEVPVTEVPVTEAPDTEAPDTEAPVTEAPVTEAPVTEAPSNPESPVMPPGDATCTPAGARCIGAEGFPAVPWLGGCCAGAGECVTAPDWGQWCSGGSAATEAPVTEEPVTEAPVTEAPVTEAPVTEAPVTDAPITEAPVTEVPVTEAPVTEAPVTEAPVTEAPVTEAPVTEAPVTEAPVTEAPVTEAPSNPEFPVMPPGDATCTPAGARCIGAEGFPAVPWLGGCCPGAGECVTAPDWGQWCSGGSAATEAPVTEEPVTEAPVTEAPVTEAPVTDAPITEAPVTEAPVTEAPVTEAPSNPGTPVMPPADATCTPAGARCTGAPGFPGVPWLGGCCPGAGDCVTAPDWGEWCSDGSTTPETPVTQAPVSPPIDAGDVTTIPGSGGNNFYGVTYSPFSLGGNDVCPPWDNDYTTFCLLSDQVAKDLIMLAQISRRIRTYSINPCPSNVEQILTFARNNGMKVQLGIWIENEPGQDGAEMNLLPGILTNYKDVISEIIVGNEMISVIGQPLWYQVEMMKKVRQICYDLGIFIPIGTAEVWHVWTDPASESLAENSDFIGLNSHPWWTGVDPFTTNVGQNVVDSGEVLYEQWNKPVIITETGFPSAGQTHMEAVPSLAAMEKAATDIETFSRMRNRGVFYFEPFDGDWKKRWIPSAYDIDYFFGLRSCNREPKRFGDGRTMNLPSNNAIPLTTTVI